MTSTTSEAGRTPARTWLRWLLGLAAAAAMSVYVWQQLPGAAYPTDLTRVGAGTPTLVLMHDLGFVAGGEVMERMNHLRADYAGRVDFLVANLKTPTGAAFAQRHGVRDGTVLLFSADGRPTGVLHQPDSAQLRSALDKAFGG
jgi:hypothetical protein